MGLTMISEVRKFFEKWDEVVEEEKIDREDKEFVLKALRLVQGGFVLDVGCGYGRHLKVLKANGFSVVGIDLANNLLKRAKLYADVIQADLRYLPIKDKIFDASICMYGALNHISNIEDGLAEIKRVTKKRIIASLYNFFSQYGIWVNLRFLIVIYGKLMAKSILKPRYEGIYKYVRILNVGENPIWTSALAYTPKDLLNKFYSVGLRKTRWKGLRKIFRWIDIFSLFIGVVSDINQCDN